MSMTVQGGVEVASSTVQTYAASKDALSKQEEKKNEFDNYDTNGDGELSQIELIKMQRETGIMVLDHDGDGVITEADFNQAMKNYGYQQTSISLDM